ncbi:MAG: hypothetical protein HY561_03475 [Gemmatimonadetes bacterium]|nr:hypothetical protein [Gemmatimonadota bacterium]
MSRFAPLFSLAALLAAALIAAALIAPAPAVAQEVVRSPYRFVDEGQSLGPFAGYVFTNTGQSELGPESGPVAGVRYAIRINGPLTLEGQASYFPTTRAVWRADTTGADTVLTHVATADLQVLALDGGLRFNITGPRTFHNLMPYLIVSGGAALDLTGETEQDRELPQDDRFKFGTTFAGQIGGGIEWFAGRRLTFRVDARNLLWELDTPRAFLHGNVPRQEWVQNFLLSAGVSLHF